MTMTFKDLQTAVARRADTTGTQINAAESNRVIGQVVDALAEEPELEVVLLKAVARKRAANAKKGAK